MRRYTFFDSFRIEVETILDHCADAIELIQTIFNMESMDQSIMDVIHDHGQAVYNTWLEVIMKFDQSRFPPTARQHLSEKRESLRNIMYSLIDTFFPLSFALYEALKTMQELLHKLRHELMSWN